VLKIGSKAVSWIVAGSACAVCLLPAHTASAQERSVRDLAAWLFNMRNYNVGINGGIGNYGRFLLENPTRSVADFNERELRGLGAWTVGGEFGANILPRVGAQLSFNYTHSNLEWRTDNGNGSEIFDTGKVTGLSHYVLGLEVIRYLLLENSRVSPFGSVGVLATWWNMSDDEDDNIFDDTLAKPDGSSFFRWGGTGSVGLQFRVAKQWRARLEAQTASIGNPFSGRSSYVSVFGRTIDEPSRVRKTYFKLGILYAFGKPRSPLPTTNGR
jgi:hypothetical protein